MSLIDTVHVHVVDLLTLHRAVTGTGMGTSLLLLRVVRPQRTIAASSSGSTTAAASGVRRCFANAVSARDGPCTSSTENDGHMPMHGGLDITGHPTYASASVPGPNGVPSRADMLRRLSASKRSEPYDVLIVGGGATGAGCAFDAATRVDEHDGNAEAAS